MFDICKYFRSARTFFWGLRFFEIYVGSKLYEDGNDMKPTAFSCLVLASKLNHGVYNKIEYTDGKRLGVGTLNSKEIADTIIDYLDYNLFFPCALDYLIYVYQRTPEVDSQIFKTALKIYLLIATTVIYTSYRLEKSAELAFHLSFLYHERKSNKKLAQMKDINTILVELVKVCQKLEKRKHYENQLGLNASIILQFIKTQ